MRGWCRHAIGHRLACAANCAMNMTTHHRCAGLVAIACCLVVPMIRVPLVDRVEDRTRPGAESAIESRDGRKSRGARQAASNRHQVRQADPRLFAQATAAAAGAPARRCRRKTVSIRGCGFCFCALLPAIDRTACADSLPRRCERQCAGERLWSIRRASRSRERQSKR